MRGGLRKSLLSLALVASAIACGEQTEAVANTVATLDEPQPCPDGEKRCGGICTKPHPMIGCGLDDCTPCPGPVGLKSACEGAQCPNDTSLRVPGDIPASEGCDNPIDVSKVPPMPLPQGPSCPDPYGEWTEFPEGDQDCCRYRCFHGHHYWFCGLEGSGGANPNGGWPRAQALCQAVGMQQLQIDDYAEDYFVLMTARYQVWIGLNNISDRNTFRWSTLTGNDGPILYQNGKLFDPRGYMPLTKGSAAVQFPRCAANPCVAYTGGGAEFWQLDDVLTAGYIVGCESVD